VEYGYRSVCSSVAFSRFALPLIGTCVATTTNFVKIVWVPTVTDSGSSETASTGLSSNT
jgi:hypothetical protein